MKIQCLSAVAASCMIAAAGCERSPLGDPWPQPRPLHHSLQAARPPADPHAAPPSALTSVEDPTGPLDLRHALALGLARSLRLSSFAWQVRAAEARMVQAGLWSNPHLDVEFENFAGSGELAGVDALETTVSLSQTFPLGGNLEKQRKLAGYEAELAGWDYEAARIELLTEITARFIEVLATQQRIALAGDALELTEQVRDNMRRRVEGGDAPHLELSRAELPVVTARVTLQRIEQRLASARRRLALTWGDSTPGFTEAVGRLDQLKPIPAPGELAKLVNENPDVARWASEISARQAAFQLARAEAMPDVTTSLGYRRLGESDDNAMVAGISLPLPIFDRRQGRQLEARIGMQAATARIRDAELRVEAALSLAYEELAAAYTAATLLRDQALPAAQQMFEALHRAFEQGNVGYLDVLDAQRTLIRLRTEHLDALQAYHSATARIEGLVGRSIEAISIEPTNQGDTN